MSEESISIDETNRIRLSLGLKPIPVENTAQDVARQQQTDSISLSETNKLRISLGLKPIEDTNAPSSQPHESTESFQATQQKREREEKLRHNLELAKSKAEKRRKINVAKSLLEDDEPEDTSDWLSKISNNSVTPKAKRSKTKKAQTSDDLAGVKVSHNIEDIDAIGGDDVILTLKDSNIMDEDDELESDLLVQKKKVEDDLAKKLRSNRYDLNGEEKSSLEMREEAMDGDRAEGFVLTGGIIKTSATTRKDEDEDVNMDPVEKRKKQMKFNLEDLDDDEEGQEQTDYAKSKPIKMKKLKKKQSKSQSRQRDATDEDGDADVLMQTVVLDNADDAFDDDSELQSHLAFKRLKKQKRNRNKTPEELAKEIEHEKENAMDVSADVQAGITIDENTEFLSSIKMKEGEGEHLVETTVQKDDDMTLVENDSNVVMEDGSEKESEPLDNDENGETEINFAGGLAGTLNFLRKKNVVKEKTKQQLDAERRELELKKEAELARIQAEIDRRKLEEQLRSDPKVQKQPKSEREKYIQDELDKLKARQNAMKRAEELKNYNPDIKVKYTDEFGRDLNQKEAYKQLSHHFHGNGNSKSKKAKTQKKAEEERQNLANESLLGRPGSEGGEGSGQAGVRIQ